MHDACVARNGQVRAVLSKPACAICPNPSPVPEQLNPLPGLACSTTCHLPNPLPHVVRYDAPPTDQPVLPRKHECQLVQRPEKWHRGEVERRRGDEATRPVGKVVPAGAYAPSPIRLTWAETGGTLHYLAYAFLHGD